jgi:hypothetical protein
MIELELFSKMHTAEVVPSTKVPYTVAHFNKLFKNGELGRLHDQKIIKDNGPVDGTGLICDSELHTLGEWQDIDILLTDVMKRNMALLFEELRINKIKAEIGDLVVGEKLDDPHFYFRGDFSDPQHHDESQESSATGFWYYAMQDNGHVIPGIIKIDIQFQGDQNKEDLLKSILNIYDEQMKRNYPGMPMKYGTMQENLFYSPSQPPISSPR